MGYSHLRLLFLIIAMTFAPLAACNSDQDVGATAVDSDSDGLTNAEEADLGTDPHDPDTDDDTLTDGAEVHQHETNPLDEDTDHDLLHDGEEVNEHHTDPVDPDSDRDELADGEEVLEHQTDPHNPDSDSDGSADGHEVGEGTNPDDSADHHTEEATFCETHTCSCEYHPTDPACVDTTASDPCAEMGGSCMLVSHCPDGTMAHTSVACEHAGAICCAPHST